MQCKRQHTSIGEFPQFAGLSIPSTIRAAHKAHIRCERERVVWHAVALSLYEHVHVLYMRSHIIHMYIGRAKYVS
jgi:hypothetical protein